MSNFYDYVCTLWVECTYGEEDENGLCDGYEGEMIELFNGSDIKKAIESSSDIQPQEDQIYAIVEKLVGNKLNTLYVSDPDGEILINKK